jgi:hypothetical protein
LRYSSSAQCRKPRPSSGYERAPKESGIFGVKYNRSISEKQSVFDVLAAGGDVEGEIVVEVASPEARQIDASRPWVLEGLGVKVLVNAFGAQLEVPLFRFDGYYDPGRARGQSPHPVR